MLKVFMMQMTHIMLHDLLESW